MHFWVDIFDLFKKFTHFFPNAPRLLSNLAMTNTTMVVVVICAGYLLSYTVGGEFTLSCIISTRLHTDTPKQRHDNSTVNLNLPCRRWTAQITSHSSVVRRVLLETETWRRKVRWLWLRSVSLSKSGSGHTEYCRWVTRERHSLDLYRTPLFGITSTDEADRRWQLQWVSAGDKQYKLKLEFSS